LSRDSLSVSAVRRLRVLLHGVLSFVGPMWQSADGKRSDPKACLNVCYLRTDVQAESFAISLMIVKCSRLDCPIITRHFDIQTQASKRVGVLFSTGRQKTENIHGVRRVRAHTMTFDCRNLFRPIPLLNLHSQC
jgi:hypothetical protein